MSSSNVEDFMKRYIDVYNISLISRSGNPSSDEEYSYNYIDDLLINIKINPNTKQFSFSKIVDMVFTLNSGTMSPFDYEGHFDRNYKRFREIVIKMKEAGIR